MANFDPGRNGSSRMILEVDKIPTQIAASYYLLGTRMTPQKAMTSGPVTNGAMQLRYTSVVRSLHEVYSLFR